MMAVLFLIGQKLEKPQIIDELMDIDKYPNRPIYEMANDVPLVLYDCVFPEMEWLTPMDFNNRNKLFRSFAGFKGFGHGPPSEIANHPNYAKHCHERRSPVIAFAWLRCRQCG